ncbi:hypothetical protein [Acetobacter sp. DsW_059]|uniref:hypothetical protein n=1 Tax=Acetobacter sp. DsW_059 TaxID=1670661 RepID=UPI000A3C8DFA|nr:hypothetical protein [Acetobacter sp. DsW_059]OUJ08270.1 hypothetical protein HK25_13580 [Acetobacter sp. DsW_059]
MSRTVTHNFQHYEARVFSERQYPLLERSLKNMGMDILYLKGCDYVSAFTCVSDRAVINFLDLSDSAVRSYALSSNEKPKLVPIVALVNSETPSHLKAMIMLEATSFLRTPICSSTVFPAVYMAINLHERKKILESTIESLNEKKKKRKYVVKYLFHFMNKNNVDEETAYKKLRAISQQNRCSVEEYAYNYYIDEV